ncbi:hypothetical protein SMD44_06803 [Streptomyces alboflavus]|uniref:Uncharacterized protein n=1 Tax=Streptomyces alboflavus TaxID=67267 RepID=A0A1Z1WLW0_9ACTN|nr:hypothetical protein SMD44_06803 [Streptomyces alboflavus]
MAVTHGFGGYSCAFKDLKDLKDFYGF